MAYITWLFRILLFLVLLGLAVRNLDIVHVHGFLDYEWKAPLALVLLAALALGALIGVAGTLRTAFVLASRRQENPAPAEPEMPAAAAAAPRSAAPAAPLHPATLRTTRDLPEDEEGA